MSEEIHETSEAFISGHSARSFQRVAVTRGQKPISFLEVRKMTNEKHQVQKRAIRNHFNNLLRWFEHRRTAYLMLFLLQLKVLWGAWEYRDLTWGDTAGYFMRASFWFKDFSVDSSWSPLYTAFYGSLLHLSSDAYLITVLHRILIVFGLTMMALALLRRLLPPSIAWLMAAWWALVPFNFDVYEVHLFGAIPMMAALWLLAYKPNRWMRGGAIAILFGSSILVRNELIITTAILAIICVFWEIWLSKQEPQTKSRRELWTYAASYGLPLLLAGLISLVFCARSIFVFSEGIASKHKLNICQAYAFGYEQRHPEWSGNPWTGFQDLMMDHFGKEMPTLFQMVRSNPSAVLEHALWNARLVPNGVQLSLFGAASGTLNPDYSPVPLHSSFALHCSMINVLILIVGLLLFFMKRHYWWKQWLRSRALGWLGMLGPVAVVLLLIFPTQRPRPEYMYGLSIFLMALTGMCIFVMAHRWALLEPLSRWMPAVMLAFLIIAPNYYANPKHISPRHLLDIYRRLTPFQGVIAKPDTVFLKGEFALEMYGYFAHLQSRVIDYGILEQLAEDTPLDVFLSERRINLFYVDKTLWSRLQSNPLHQRFLTSPESVGWRLIGLQDSGSGKWMLFQKYDAASKG